MTLAEDRYYGKKARCKELLKAIETRLDAHTPPNYDVNWEHVGDLSQVWQELKAIHEFLSHDEEE